MNVEIDGVVYVPKPEPEKKPHPFEVAYSDCYGVGHLTRFNPNAGKRSADGATLHLWNTAAKAAITLWTEYMLSHDPVDLDAIGKQFANLKYEPKQ